MQPSSRCRNALVMLVMAWSAGCTRAPATAPPPAIVGAWRSSPQFTSGVFASTRDLQFLYVFNVGGTMTESSNYDQAPPVPPAYGEWRATGPNAYEARYIFFTTMPPKDPKSIATGGWAPAGHGVLVERIQVSADGRSFDSTMQMDLFDMAGRMVEGGGQAHAHGVRAGF